MNFYLQERECPSRKLHCYYHFSLISHNILSLTPTSSLQISSQYLGIFQKLFNINLPKEEIGITLKKKGPRDVFPNYHLNTYILRCVQGPFFTLMPQPSFIPQTTAGQIHKHYASSDVVHRHSGDAPSHTSDVVITRMNILFDFTLFYKSKCP